MAQLEGFMNHFAVQRLLVASRSQLCEDTVNEGEYFHHLIRRIDTILELILRHFS
jgi:hypothetical protein